MKRMNTTTTKQIKTNFFLTDRFPEEDFDCEEGLSMRDCERLNGTERKQDTVWLVPRLEDSKFKEVKN